MLLGNLGRQCGLRAGAVVAIGRHAADVESKYDWDGGEPERDTRVAEWNNGDDADVWRQQREDCNDGLCCNGGGCWWIGECDDDQQWGYTGFGE